MAKGKMYPMRFKTGDELLVRHLKTKHNVRHTTDLVRLALYCLATGDVPKQTTPESIRYHIDVLAEELGTSPSDTDKSH